MNRPIEQIAEQLGIGFKGKRPIINGVQLGRGDIAGLLDYDNEVNPQPDISPDSPIKSTRIRFIQLAGSRLKRLPHKHTNDEDGVARNRRAGRLATHEVTGRISRYPLLTRYFPDGDFFVDGNHETSNLIAEDPNSVQTNGSLIIEPTGVSLGSILGPLLEGKNIA